MDDDNGVMIIIDRVTNADSNIEMFECRFILKVENSAFQLGKMYVTELTMSPHAEQFVKTYIGGVNGYKTNGQSGC